MTNLIGYSAEAKALSGTVGESVLTVHKVHTQHDQHGDPFVWPICGADKKGDPVTEWLRAVNCAACLSA